MKIYGIASEYWGGSDYYCAYDEDIRLFFSEDKRDNEFGKLQDDSNVKYYKFETETED